MTVIDISRAPLLQLAPGIHILRRGRNAVQCGLDARRGAIIEVEKAALVTEALRLLYQPTPQHVLHSRLLDAGVPAVFISDLIEELIGYGIIQHHQSHTVLVVGSTPFAQYMREHLREKSITVRSPLAGESPTRTFRELPSPPLVLLVDTFGVDNHTAVFLARNARHLISAAVIDSTAYITTLRQRGEGLCPRCIDLTATEHDPAFMSIARQFMQVRIHRQDPTLIAAAAAVTGIAVEDVLGTPRATGEPAPHRLPGEMKIVEPYSEQVHTQLLEPHPHCPICHSLAQPLPQPAAQTLDKAA